MKWIESTKEFIQDWYEILGEWRGILLFTMCFSYLAIMIGLVSCIAFEIVFNLING